MVPVGNGNMMLILDYVLHLAQMMSFEEIDDALKFLTVNGATTLGLRDMYGLEAGKPANFIVLDAISVFNAVYERCSVLRSVRAGRTLFTREETSSLPTRPADTVIRQVSKYFRHTKGLEIITYDFKAFRVSRYLRTDCLFNRFCGFRKFVDSVDSAGASVSAATSPSAGSVLALRTPHR